MLVALAISNRREETWVTIQVSSLLESSAPTATLPGAPSLGER